VCLHSSLQIFDKYPMQELRKKSVLLTAYAEKLLQEIVPDKVKIVTPANPEERGAQLSLVFSITSSQQQEQEKKQVRDIEAILADEGVVCDVRGNVIRVAPTPLYNTFTDVYKFVHILKKVLDQLQKENAAKL